jgi:hypothetical protein
VNRAPVAVDVRCGCGSLLAVVEDFGVSDRYVVRFASGGQKEELLWEGPVLEWPACAGELGEVHCKRCSGRMFDKPAAATLRYELLREALAKYRWTGKKQTTRWRVPRSA